MKKSLVFFALVACLSFFDFKTAKACLDDDEASVASESAKTEKNPESKAIKEPKKTKPAKVAVTLPPQPIPVIVVAGFNNPESVVRDLAGDHYFVSNLGVKLDPSGKDGDGYISKLGKDGKVLAKRFLPLVGKLNAPKGMAVIGHTLYVTDIDRIVGFDLKTRRTVFETSLAATKTKFLNDLAVVDSHTLLVSATDLGKLYKVALKHKDTFTQYAVLPGANGLYKDGSKWQAVSFGTGMKLNGGAGVITGSKAAHYTAYKSVSGGLDGVFRNGTKIYMTDWVAFGKPGVIHVYDLKRKTASILRTGWPVMGPADFLFDRETDKVWLPAMLEGKIYIFALGGT